jgi:protein-S-isoprenylcysteine O-methyltransferase Ste14
LRRGGTWIQRWRVPLGFLSAALFVWLARPRPITLHAGAAIAVIGLAIRAWASGHIRKNDALAMSGPYAYTRNPLYLGSFVLGLGFTIAANHWILYLIFATLFFGIYLPVMRVEASTLAHKFGKDYESYAGNVPLFFPRLIRPRRQETPATDFDSALYLRYREYRAAIGFLIAWALLVVKTYYLK